MPLPEETVVPLLGFRRTAAPAPNRLPERTAPICVEAPSFLPSSQRLLSCVLPAGAPAPATEPPPAVRLPCAPLRDALPLVRLQTPLALVSAPWIPVWWSLDPAPKACSI